MNATQAVLFRAVPDGHMMGTIPPLPGIGGDQPDDIEVIAAHEDWFAVDIRDEENVAAILQSHGIGNLTATTAIIVEACEWEWPLPFGSFTDASGDALVIPLLAD